MKPARDPLFIQAARLSVTHGSVNPSVFQRRLKVPYARAAVILDQLEKAGIVDHYKGVKYRDVLVDDTFIDGIMFK